MKNSKLRRILMLMACAVLLVCLSVGATLAYLTAKTQTVTNEFAVGEVTFDDGTDDDDDDIVNGLDEGTVWAYKDNKEDHGRHNDAGASRTPDGNEYKLVPGRLYHKDPTVHIGADSEDAWLFVQVVNGIVDIETTEDAATIKGQMEAKGWVLIDEEDNVWAWPKKVVAGQDVVVFDTFTINGAVQTGTEEQAIADGVHVVGNKYLGDYEEATITIQAYLVQADGLGTYQIAWDAAPLAQWDVTPDEETPADPAA